MCDDGPDPVYQGKTYRRQKVALNDDTLSQYGGAWRGGKNNNGTVANSIQASQTLVRNPAQRNPFGFAVPGGGGDYQPFVDAGSVTSRPNPAGGMFPNVQPETFKVNARLDPGVYGADDGSFLSSSTVSRSSNRANSVSPSSFFNNGPAQYETYRYVEDPNGKYGVDGYGDNGTPTKFNSLSNYDIRSTSGKKELKLMNQPEPVKTDTPTDRRKRQTGSVSTSSFRIELGTPSKKSGLRVPL